MTAWTGTIGTFQPTAEIPAGTAATAILPSGAGKPLYPGVNDLSEPRIIQLSRFGLQIG